MRDRTLLRRMRLRHALIGVAVALVAPAVASAAISGTAFRDYDADGSQDSREPGLTGIQVQAINDAGAILATATTAADGTYSLTGIAPGTKVRVEFSGQPSYLKQGGNGAGAGSSVMFATEGDAGVDHGLNNPAEFCEANPQIATACQFYGRFDSTFANKGGLRVFGFNTSGFASERNDSVVGDPSLAPTSASFAKIGSTFGLAYQRESRSLFAAAFYKRASGFGPSGPGAIYRITPGADNQFGTADDDATTFLDLGAAAGTDVHPNVASTDPLWQSDESAWTKIGKSSLGGIELSDDGQTLYVMNLEDRKLYVAPIGTTPTAPAPAAIRTVDMPDPADCVADPATPGGELNLNVRPFAVGYQDGAAYVGLTCTGESTQLVSDMKAFVYRFDDPGFTRVLDVPFDFSRAGSDMTWYPWSDATTGGPVYDWEHGEPMLSDIEWDGEDILLGIRDRRGDQSGYALGSFDGGFSMWTAVSGDLLRACRADAGGESYLLESNGSAPSGCRRSFGTGYGAGNGQGPGGGEFYGDAAFGYHDDASMGGIAQVPGSSDVIAAIMDSNQMSTSDSYVNANGVRRMSNVDGSPTQALELTANCFTTCQSNDEGGFGKANGIGDLEAICQSAPIEIGNRVWLDDGDGVQDPSEAPVSGVTVNLYDASNTLIATTTTDTNGRYVFSSAGPDMIPGNGDDLGGYGPDLLPNTADDVPGIKPDQTYSVRLDNAADYAASGPLADTTATVDGATAASGSSVSDSDGIVSSSTDVRASVTTGVAGANNHTLDFGFVLNAEIGDVVWYDTNKDGVQDGGETGVVGVKVSLKDSTGAVIATTTTDASGNYLFPGLVPGDYTVVFDKATLPVGFLMTTQNAGAATAATDSDADPVTGATATINLSAGESDLTWDLGIVEDVAQLGDVVWYDTNKNGIQDSGETGVAGVTVNLKDSSNAVVATKTTDASGKYLFTNLVPGDYSVVFDTTTLPAGFVITTQNAPGSTGANGSDADRTSGATATTNLTAGESDLTWDMGIYNPAATAAAKLSITKQSRTQRAHPGQKVSFVLRVKNTGTTAATNVSVCDMLPSRMTFVAVPSGAKIVNGALCFKVSSLAVGAVRQYTVKVLIAPVAMVGYLTNTATATAGNVARGSSAKARILVSGAVLGQGIPGVTG